MEDCLFCKIIKGEIPSKKVYEDEYVYAFADIAPQAPFHAVVVPKVHISSAAEIDKNNSLYVSKIYEAIAVIAKNENLEKVAKTPDFVRNLAFLVGHQILNPNTLHLLI